MPLIDADVLVYRVGFAAEQDEPIENVLHSVKKCVIDILSQFPGAPEHHLFLTGSGNFRKDIATRLEYKGHRKDQPKPQYYDEIREYLQNRWQAKMIVGMEADDAMGIMQFSRYRSKSVICSIDKDMKMIPGWHYNFVKRMLEYVDRETAHRNFFRQLLTGDMTDNIPGIKGMGPKTAAKLIGDEVDAEKLYDICKREYRKAYGENEWQSAIDEMAQLLWILRAEDRGCPFMTTGEGWCPRTASPSGTTPTTVLS